MKTYPVIGIAREALLTLACVIAHSVDTKGV